MDVLKIKNFLSGVRSGAISDDEALKFLKGLPYEDIGFANIDHHRSLRQGFPEAIFCQGKTPEEVKVIAESILKKTAYGLLATRADKKHYDAVLSAVPDAVYHEKARIITVKRFEPPKEKTSICILTAGTSDIPVAEEAAITAEMLSNPVVRVYDVGTAGIHRLFSRLDTINQSAVIIVVAGMEGALASVVGGIFDKPIIAVPTSVGYGSSFGGLSALLTMLNSCSAGIGVVNIDNGFGAAFLASRINRMS